MFGIHKKLFGSIAALAFVVGCSGADGGGAPAPAPAPSEAHEEVGGAESAMTNQASSSCDCSSTFTCPSNGYQVEYFAVGCGYPSYWQAGADCRNHCGGATCRLGSWTCP